MPVRVGLDRLCGEQTRLIRGRRLGVLTNPSGVTADLTGTVEALESVAGAVVDRLFAPEHGYYGVEDDAKPVPDQTEPFTGRPVYSLFGDRLAPGTAELDGLDAVVFDIQDVGARFYTYTTTLLHTMRAAADAGVQFIVCDRPNPIGGVILEGPILDDSLRSFLGSGPLPIRHGLTAGELACLYRDRWSVEADLVVIPCDGWQRSMLFRDTALLWIPPSPAMPRAETAITYPGTCLFEGTNVSEGRGTGLPFEQIGAPFLDTRFLVDRLRSIGLPGVAFRETRFKPCSDQWAGSVCYGVQLHPTNPDRFRPLTAALHLLQLIMFRHPKEFAWRLPHIDQLLGDLEARKALETGVPVDEIVAGWEQDHHAFDQERRAILLYP